MNLPRNILAPTDFSESAESVAQTAPCPVLLVRKVKRPLVALDASDRASKVLEAAVRLADRNVLVVRTLL